MTEGGGGFISVSISGAAELAAKFAELPGALLAAGRRGVRKGGVVVARRLLDRVSRVGPKTEALGRLAQLNPNVAASVRGRSALRAVLAGRSASDFLFRRSGNLAASVNSSPEAENTPLGPIARVGFRRGVVDVYAPVQEFGTDRAGIHHNVHIPARAPVRKALEDRREEVQAIIAAEVKAALDKFDRGV